MIEDLILTDYLQAQDRIHRISQKHECNIYNLMVADSIDIWVDYLLKAKQEAAFLAQGDKTLELYRQQVDYSFSKNRKKNIKTRRIMNTKRIIIIAGQHIEVEEKCLKHSDLDFYPENPRIYNTIHAEIGDNPTQKVIESAMKKLDSVKTLKQSIEVNGGLLEPIIVRRNVVLEGNSRLAAYRMLAEKDPIKWADIRCNVLPDDTSDDVVFSLLGTLHIIGKTPWSPFEQAGYLYRRTQTSRKTYNCIS